MNRQEGIFHRRNVQTSMASARSEDTTRAESEVDEVRPNEDEDVDVDSKETRLTLMEEVLLLGLKDKEVNWLWCKHFSRPRVKCGCAGALKMTALI